ncbi:MAG: SAM-dependent methyltransferase [Flavobacteriales bacterium]|nr:SAM-dependent methyltransferase [Flavobacteriales bacterium]MEB2342282.1 SAM-dependent methyltransferase [Flavobacteriia bacterium]
MNLPRTAEGVLYLLPVWLGDAGGPELLPPANIAVARQVKLFFCEHERTARRMLRRMAADIDLDAIELLRLDTDTTPAELDRYALLLGTRDAAIISEAGMPAIADPGARLVARAHRRGVAVLPLTGPSSLFLALAASGMNGQQFCFHGYLPRETARRRQQIKKLEQAAQREGAQLFIETPYRNDALLTDLLEVLAPPTRLCLAVNLEQPDASVITRTVGEWRKARPTLGKRPCVFIVGK